MPDALPNLFDYQPVRAARFEVGQDGLVTLLVPRFTNRLLVRFLVPLLRSPDYRLHLDAIGSFVWQQCDGQTTVAEIGDRAVAQFGGEPVMMGHRCGEFLARMDREGFVLMRLRGAQSAAG